MTIRKITLLSLIGILLTVHIFQICFSNKGSVKEITAKGIPEIIILQNHNASFELCKKEGMWLLNNKHPAKGEFADYISKCLCEIKVIETVSKNPKAADLEKYDLANPVVATATTATGTVIQKILVGKSSTTGNQTYIKFADKKEIYLISGNLKSFLEITPSELADFTLYSVKPDEIYKVEKYSAGNLVYNLEKTGEEASVEWKVVNTSDEEKFKDINIQSWVSSISSLSAEQWIEDFDILDVDAMPDSIFVIGAAGRDITVKLFNIDEEKTVCICSENSYPCYISKESAEKLSY